MASTFTFEKKGIKADQLFTSIGVLTADASGSDLEVDFPTRRAKLAIAVARDDGSIAIASLGQNDSNIEDNQVKFFNLTANFVYDVIVFSE